MSVTYGVDFGTSRSSIAIRDASGRIVDVPLGGEYSMPSSVCRTRTGELTVGHRAEAMKLANLDGYRRDFKRFTRRQEPFQLGGARVHAVDMVAAILTHLRNEAKRINPEPPEMTVLTIPIAWAAGEESLMRQAATKAGFDPQRLRLEHEPVAALRHAFATLDAEQARTVLVYDLGGGTFDCAVATRRGDRFVARPFEGGLPELGGRDFNNKVREILREQHPDRVRRLDDPNNDAEILRDVLAFDETCEKIKCQLSERDEFTEPVPELGVLDVTVTRQDFERAIALQLGQTIEACEDLLTEAGIWWDDIDLIAAVGGSSKIPLVSATLAQRSGRPVHVVENPDLAVVRGAALLAADPVADREALPSRHPAPPPKPPAPPERAPQQSRHPEQPPPEPGRQTQASPLAPVPEGWSATIYQSVGSTTETAPKPVTPLPRDSTNEWSRYALRPKRRQRNIGLAVLSAAAFVGAAGSLSLIPFGLAARTAAGIAAVASVLLGILSLRRGHSRPRPPLVINSEGINVDGRTHRWEDVRSVRFVDAPKLGRHLEVGRFDDAKVPRVRVTELYASEHDVERACRRFAASRVGG